MKLFSTCGTRRFLLYKSTSAGPMSFKFTEIVFHLNRRHVKTCFNQNNLKTVFRMLHEVWEGSTDMNAFGKQPINMPRTLEKLLILPYVLLFYTGSLTPILRLYSLRRFRGQHFIKRNKWTKDKVAIFFLTLCHGIHLHVLRPQTKTITFMHLQDKWRGS